ncbi:CBS domain-containing protein [Candidatus Binatia bacterium]|nr:CBS domain-containing protein [Candidatus Binatia bacterium]
MHDDIVLEEESIADERAAEAIRLGTALLREPIRALATLKPAIAVPPTVSVRDAITHMKKAGVGCVLIEEGDRLIGIFTERDVLTKVAGTTVDVDRTEVRELMTPDPECLRQDDRAAYALNRMTVGGFRHIPLVDKSGRPVGVVSMRNVVEYFVDVFGQEVLNLPPQPDSKYRDREGA